MNKHADARRARAMMTSASIVALCAFAPAAALAQTALNGAPGQALTGGTVSSAGASDGQIWDQGPGWGVTVSAAPNDTVTVDAAVIGNTQEGAGLAVNSFGFAPGLLTVLAVGANNLHAPGSALSVSSGAESIRLDTSAGGSLYAGDTGLSAVSNAGNVLVLNGANTITAARTGIFAAANGPGGAVVVGSTGGSILAGGYGVAAQSNLGGFGGDVLIGQAGGLATAITVTDPLGVGISAVTSGLGTIDVRTGAGGTIDGGMTGISADTLGGAGAVTIGVGAAIGGTTAPSSTGVSARSNGGDVTVDATAAIRAGVTGISAATSGGGAIEVRTGAVTTTSGRAIELVGGTGPISVVAGGPIAGGFGGINATGSGAITVTTVSTVSGGASTGVAANSSGFGPVAVGTAEQRLGGAVTGGTTGIFAAGAGDVSVYAGAVTGGTRGIVAASQLAPTGAGSNGAVTVDVTGPVMGQSSFGIVGVNNGVLTTNTLTIRAADVTSTGGSAISAQAEGGDIFVSVSGALKANAAANGSWDALYAEGYGNNNIALATSGPVTGSWRGIDAIANSATTRGAITVTALGPVSGQTGVSASSSGVGGIDLNLGAVTGTNGAGLFASGAGDVDVVTGAVSSTGGTGVTFMNNVATGVTAASGYGIAGLSSGGNVTIDANGAVTGGAAGGILAQTLPGGGAIALDTLAVTAAVGRAIEADAAGGAITIHAGGAIDGASSGIIASNSGTGAITITATGDVTGRTGAAINAATNGGSGAVSIGTADQRLGGTATGGTTAIFAASAGDVSVYAGAVTGGTRGIVAANQYAGANGSVVIDAAGPVVGLSSFGIIGVTNGLLASNTLTIRAGDVTSTGGSAISAQAFGGGDISIATTGAIKANAGPNGSWDAIYAQGDHDNDIAIVATGPVTGSWHGIEATAFHAASRGAISITATGPVTGMRGVSAISTGVGGIDLQLGDVTSTNGAGVYASGAGNVNVSTGTVTAAGGTAATIAGNVATGATAATGYGIAALSSGGTVTVNATGTVTGGAAGGILAQTTPGAGAISITTATVKAAAGRGVEAESAGGAVTVLAGGPVTAASDGLYVRNSGHGAVSVTAGSVTAGATGVLAVGAGDVTVRAGAISGGTRGVVAANQGADVNGAVLVELTGPVTAANGFGVVGVNNGTLAANTLTLHTGAVTSTNGSGISAQSGGGDVSIVTTGPVTANAGANGTWDGVYAYGELGSHLSVTTGGAVTGSFNGIEAYSLGSNANAGITVDTHGDVAGGTGRAAILAEVAGLGSLNVTTAAGTTLSAVDGTGVLAIASNGEGANGVRIVNGADVGGTGAAPVLNGVVAQVAAGNAGAISIASSGAIHASNAGILALTQGSGAVDVALSGAIATTGTGISASTLSGELTVATTAAGTVAPGAQVGIDARSVSGAITIEQAGAIGAAGEGNGVGVGVLAEIQSGSADLTVNSSGDIYVASGSGVQSAGIYAVNGGTGAVSVTTTGVIDPGAYGLVLQGGGAVNYTLAAGSVEGGLGAYVSAAGPLDVTTAAGTTLTGLTGPALAALGNGGGVSLVLAGTVDGATSGVVTSNTGAGGVSINVDGTVTGRLGNGIDVATEAGAINLTVAGTVTGTGIGAVGVNLVSTGGGDVSLTNTGTIVGQTVGVSISTSGTVIRTDGFAAPAATAVAVPPSGALSFTNTGTIAAADGVGLQLVSAGTANVHNTGTITGSDGGLMIDAAGGTVLVNDGVITAAEGQLALQFDGGPVEFRNHGAISGAVDFGSAGAGLLVNDGLWIADVDADFGGTARRTPDSHALASGPAGESALAGTLGTFSNLAGSVVLVAPAATSGKTVTWSGLAGFDNQGLIDLRQAVGHTGDVFVLDGAAYSAGADAALAVDARLSGAITTDKLVMGSATGRTRVFLRDLTPDAPATLDFTGATVVDATSAAGSEFALAGPVRSGFVVYDLVFRAAGADFDLVALPDTAGFEMTRAPAAAREYVRHGEDAWSSRTAEIRDAGSARGDGWEFWAQAYAGGRRLERTTDFALPGGLTSGPQALTLDNDWHGLQLGADRRMGEVLVGFTGGIQQQETRVRADLNGFDLSGGNLGAYAGVSSGPFFLNGLARGDWWSTDARMRTVGADTSFDGRAVTAKVETGLRLGGPKLRFEPLADLAWSRVSLDDAAFGSLATRFRFADVDGWTGSLGARVGGTWGLTSPWIGAYWVGGSGGDADVTMLTGAGCPSCVTLTDARPKNYGRVDFGFTSGTGWRGLEGFARGEALFGADTSGFAARAGVRWRW